MAMSRTFDPSSPDAARWRMWLQAALAARHVPADARIDLAWRPLGEVPVVRLSLDAFWIAADGEQRHARAVALTPCRRLLGCGWPGWPAYLVGIRLVQAID